MTRYLAMLVIFAGLAGVVPHFFELYADSPSLARRDGGADAGTAAVAVTGSGDTLPEAPYLGGGRVAVLHRDFRGHYGGVFKLNGRKIEGIVDTGATYIALNESTARSIGIFLQPDDFTSVVETANGRTKAARARIDTVAIGQISEDNVTALVLPDAAMPDTLIGMNFLNRLTSYEVRSGVLNLKD